MNFGESADAAGDKNAVDRLKAIERQFGWTAEDWHFKLVQQFDEPMKVYAWFGQAKMRNKLMYFDGSTPRGTLCYDWVRKNYRRQVQAALGEIEYCLASRGQILRSAHSGE